MSVVACVANPQYSFSENFRDCTNVVALIWFRSGHRWRGASASDATAQQKKPNILIIWGDDIGYDNISAYNHGIMGYRTPNIDRLAKEGGIFTDAYAHRKIISEQWSSMQPSKRTTKTTL